MKNKVSQSPRYVACGYSDLRVLSGHRDFFSFHFVTRSSLLFRLPFLPYHLSSFFLFHPLLSPRPPFPLRPSFVLVPLLSLLLHSPSSPVSFRRPPASSSFPLFYSGTQGTCTNVAAAFFEVIYLYTLFTTPLPWVVVPCRRHSTRLPYLVQLPAFHFFSVRYRCTGSGVVCTCFGNSSWPLALTLRSSELDDAAMLRDRLRTAAGEMTETIGQEVGQSVLASTSSRWASSVAPVKPEGKWNPPRKTWNTSKKLDTWYSEVSVSALNRGVLKRKVGRCSIHFTAESSNTELLLRTIH